MHIQAVAKSVPESSAAIHVQSRAVFSVGVVLWRDESARVLATVVAKATYNLAPGTSDVVDPPDPIRDLEEGWEDGGAGSLKFPSDLAPFKPAHEVLVVGHVYANGNHPTRSATGRIVIGEIEKSITATASRRSDRDGQLQNGPPQSRFSLRYEFAAGGIHNPVGIDPTDFTPTGGHILPQLTPHNHVVRPGDYVPLVGFGPVHRSWIPRDSLLRPEDREWLLDPLRRPRPRGFDPRYFCAAPIDQRSTEALRADERLILEGLHPKHARLVTNLGGVAPALRSAGSKRPLPPFVADTLYIDTDRQIATLAFRAIVPLDDDKLDLDIVPEGYRDPASPMVGDATTELDRSAFRGALSALGAEGTTELDRSAFRDAASTPLPFAPSSEPRRALVQNTADGALPFRRSLHPPPSSLPSTPVTSNPSNHPPPSVHLAPSPLTTNQPPPSAPRASSPPQPPPRPLAPPPPPPPPAPPPPPPARSAAQPPPRPSLVSAPPPSTFAEVADSVPRTEEKDLLRKMFGTPLGRQGIAEPGGAEPRAPKAGSSPPPASGGTKSVPDAAVALGKLKALSDAAAAHGAARVASDSLFASEKRGAAVPLERSAGVSRRAIVDLLAFDPGVPNRLRRSKTHAPLLTEQVSSRTPRKVDEPAGEQDAEARARIDVLRVLSCGTPLGPEELQGAFDALLDDPNDFDIPLFLVEGDVKPTMDEVETLRVAVDVAKPLAGNSKRVQGAIAVANEALSRTAPPVSEAAATLYKQLETATSELSLPPRHLADMVDRTLLEARTFKKRTLLGAPRIRAELTLGRVALPIYLPDDAASQLPLLPVFSMAALVEFRPREDASEPNPVALVAFALGRVLRVRR